MPAAATQSTGKRSKRGRLNEGAPTLRTKALTESIAESVSLGLTDEESALIAGITPETFAYYQSDRVGSGSCPDRVLLCRAVHCCRELAQQRCNGPDPGTDPERLRHDGAGGWDRRTTPSPGDRPGGLQSVLHSRDHYRIRLGADRSD